MVAATTSFTRSVELRREDELSSPTGRSIPLFGMISDLEIPMDSGDFCLMHPAASSMQAQSPSRNVAGLCEELRGFLGFFGRSGSHYDRRHEKPAMPKSTLRKTDGTGHRRIDQLQKLPLAPRHLRGPRRGGHRPRPASMMPSAIRRPARWASTMIVVLFMVAVQLLSPGRDCSGEYVRLIFLEAEAAAHLYGQ